MPSPTPQELERAFYLQGFWASQPTLPIASITEADHLTPYLQPVIKFLENARPENVAQFTASCAAVMRASSPPPFEGDRGFQLFAISARHFLANKGNRESPAYPLIASGEFWKRFTTQIIESELVSGRCDWRSNVMATANLVDPQARVTPVFGNANTHYFCRKTSPTQYETHFDAIGMAALGPAGSNALVLHEMNHAILNTFEMSTFIPALKKVINTSGEKAVRQDINAYEDEAVNRAGMSIFETSKADMHALYEGWLIWNSYALQKNYSLANEIFVTTMARAVHLEDLPFKPSDPCQKFLDDHGVLIDRLCSEECLPFNENAVIDRNLLLDRKEEYWVRRAGVLQEIFDAIKKAEDENPEKPQPKKEQGNGKDEKPEKGEKSDGPPPPSGKGAPQPGDGDPSGDSQPGEGEPSGESKPGEGKGQKSEPSDPKDQPKGGGGKGEEEKPKAGEKPDPQGGAGNGGEEKPEPGDKTDPQSGGAGDDKGEKGDKDGKGGKGAGDKPGGGEGEAAGDKPGKGDEPGDKGKSMAGTGDASKGGKTNDRPDFGPLAKSGAKNGEMPKRILIGGDSNEEASPEERKFWEAMEPEVELDPDGGLSSVTLDGNRLSFGSNSRGPLREIERKFSRQIAYGSQLFRRIRNNANDQVRHRPKVVEDGNDLSIPGLIHRRIDKHHSAIFQEPKQMLVTNESIFAVVIDLSGSMLGKAGKPQRPKISAVGEMAAVSMLAIERAGYRTMLGVFAGASALVYAPDEPFGVKEKRLARVVEVTRDIETGGPQANSASLASLLSSSQQATGSTSLLHAMSNISAGITKTRSGRPGSIHVLGFTDGAFNAGISEGLAVKNKLQHVTFSVFCYPNVPPATAAQFGAEYVKGIANLDERFMAEIFTCFKDGLEKAGGVARPTQLTREFTETRRTAKEIDRTIKPNHWR